MSITVDKFGRVLIPKKIRDRMGLKPGTELDLDLQTTESGETLEMRTRSDAPALVRKGLLLVHRGRFEDPEFDIVKSISDQREERLRRNAGHES